MDIPQISLQEDADLARINKISNDLCENSYYYFTTSQSYYYIYLLHGNSSVLKNYCYQCVLSE